MIDKVKKLVSEGHDIVLWTGGGAEYARKAAIALGINNVTTCAKPDLMVDNEVEKWSRRLSRRLITPEEFLEKEIPSK